MSDTVAMNNFALRHVEDSPYSHFNGSFDGLCDLVEENLGLIQALSPDGGVSKVTLSGEGFFTAVTQVTPDTLLRGYYEARSDEESPYLSFKAVAGPKIPAAEVDIILYSHENLAIKNEQSTEADWEIISINAKPYRGEEPPHPVTMARNFFDLPGGTAREHTAQEFAESILHWLGGGSRAPYVMLDPNH